MVNLLWLDKNNQYNVKREKGNILPKDKSNTTAKITRYLTEEFLTYGYEKASLNRVSAKVGITTAGLYKHFAGKEDMFYSLVKKTLDDFNNMTSWAGDRMNTETDYDPFDDDWTAQWVDFIYSHYVGMKLLICCSTGSKFESFEDDLIQMEADGNKAYAAALSKAGKMTREVSDMQWHILATAYVHLIFETVRHDMTRKEAMEHVRFARDLLYPGWREIFGL